MTTGNTSNRNGDNSEAVTRDPVAKAFSLLNHLCDSNDKSWTARGLAAQLRVPVSTVHRTLTSLTNASVLRQDPITAAYEFSAGFQRIARRVVSRFALPELAHEHLFAISQETKETALLGVLDEDANRMMFASQVEGGHPLRYVVPLNTWVSLDKGASGWAILAFLHEDRRAAVIENADFESGELTKQKFEEELRVIKSRGYAVSHGRRIHGATGIAAPIFGPSGVVGDLMVTMPHVRFVAEEEVDLARLVMAKANELTRTLGGETNKDGELA